MKTTRKWQCKDVPKEHQDFCKKYFGGSSYRDIANKDLEKLYKDCKNTNTKQECQMTIRGLYRNIERGRYSEAIDKTHSMIARLDQDEIQLYFKKHPHMKKPLDTHATIEEVARFKK